LAVRARDPGGARTGGGGESALRRSDQGHPGVVASGDVSDSIRFDTAADHYDKTRAVSDDTMDPPISLLSPELRDRGRVLEVGVGTGLLALRLHEAGIPVSGLDLSAPMRAKPVQKAGGGAAS